MSVRKNRRAVMAELLLLASPSAIYAREDGTSLALDFDTIAELRSWLCLAGLDTPDLLTGEHEGSRSDGRPYRSLAAYPTWHGWDFYATATEHIDPVPPLDPQTADKLAALAVTP